MISSGTLQLGNGGATGSIVSDITNNSILSFDRTDAYSFDHVISGNGTINQIGTGNLILTGNSGAFAGATNVNSGTLTVDGTLGGTVAVASGAILSGDGRITGDTTIANNATLTEDAGKKLSFGGNLTLNNTSNVTISFSGSNSPELFDIAGDLVLGGKINVSDFGDQGPGIYRVFQYGGTATGTMTVGTLPSDITDPTEITIQYDTTDKFISLVYSSGGVLNIWDGATGHDNGVVDGGNGVWDTVNTNWTEDPAYLVNGHWAEGQFAIFGKTAGLVQVDNTNGAVTASGMQFQVTDYEITGLSATDVLMLVADPSRPGKQPIIRVGNGAFDDMQITSTISVILAGTDGMKKDYGGRLILTGNNTYTGGTVVANGVLQLGDGGSNGSILGDVVLGDGADGAGVLIFNRSDAVSFAGNITGFGHMVKDGSGTLTLSGNNLFNGGVTVSNGTLYAGVDGTVFGRGVLDVQQAGIVDLLDAEVNIFGLSGDGRLDLGDGTLTSDQGMDTLFSGIVTGDGNLIKEGTGTLTLSGANDYTGKTEVNAGVLMQGALNSFSGHSSLYSIGTDGTLALGGFDTTLAALTNAGTLDFGNGTAGTTLTVTGNYTGSGGTIILNALLKDDNSVTDMLIVQGDTSGDTNILVKDRGGLGGQTDNGIKVVEVGGASNGTFSLINDYTTKDGQKAIVVHGYAYTLQKGDAQEDNDNNWYLVSQSINPLNPQDPRYGPNVPVYEGYMETMRALLKLPTLQQRVGNRQNNDGEAGREQENHTVSNSGVWARIDSAHNKYSTRSTTQMQQDIDTVIMQSGIDGLFYEGDDGRFFAGLFGSYGTAQSNIWAQAGDGKIQSTAWSLGASATWYGSNGFYFDTQGQISWIESDLSSRTANTTLGRDKGATGYAMSVEAGRKIQYDENWTITPQGQLIWSSLNADMFDDLWGARLDLTNTNSLVARLGVAAEFQKNWQTADGHNARSTVYGIANIYHEFIGDSKINISGESFNTNTALNWVGVGVGATYSWVDQAYTIYAEGAVDTSLSNFGNDYSMKGTVGFRAKW